jgi:protein phosphatase
MTMRWNLVLGFATDTGRARERNEDAFDLYVPYNGEAKQGRFDALFVVADGMGGHEAGDLASRYVTETVTSELTAGDAGEIEPAVWIERVLRHADRGLRELARAQKLSRSAGSTATVAALASETLHIVHVGDSRCYRHRDGVLEQITRDHSWVAEQVRAGLLSPEEAAVHPNRNMLTQSLGVGQQPEVFRTETVVREGDRFLLCTDGLHGVIPDTVLLRVLAEERDAQEAASRLVRVANEAGGPDNITAVVFDVQPLVLEAATLEAAMPATELTATNPGSPVAARRGRVAAKALMLGGALLVVAAAALGTWHYLSPGTRPEATGRAAADSAQSTVAGRDSASDSSRSTNRDSAANRIQSDTTITR